MESFEVPAAVHAALASFIDDSSILALPITLNSGQLQALPLFKPSDSNLSPKQSLTELNTILDPRTCRYLLLRRNNSIVAITFIPYLAEERERDYFVEHRHELVNRLGSDRFSYSLVCKEVGEITDIRSWEERNANELSAENNHNSNEEEQENNQIKDLGYQRNKCRLCDRRMQNPITPNALTALKTLINLGTVVQITIDIPSLTLTLHHTSTLATPSSLPSLLPTTHPSFTFFHHPATSLIYFIYHSPDSAPVQSRMKHTMAIPGLLVYAEDSGLVVDQKIEIHEPGELEEVGVWDVDERVGRYRSMYDRKGFKGTELVYERLGADKGVIDGLG